MHFLKGCTTSNGFPNLILYKDSEARQSLTTFHSFPLPPHELATEMTERQQYGFAHPYCILVPTYPAIGGPFTSLYLPLQSSAVSTTSSLPSVQAEHVVDASLRSSAFSVPRAPHPRIIPLPPAEDANFQPARPMHSRDARARPSHHPNQQQHHLYHHPNRDAVLAPPSIDPIIDASKYSRPYGDTLTVAPTSPLFWDLRNDPVQMLASSVGIAFEELQHRAAVRVRAPPGARHRPVLLALTLVIPNLPFEVHVRTSRPGAPVSVKDVLCALYKRLREPAQDGSAWVRPDGSAPSAAQGGRGTRRGIELLGYRTRFLGIRRVWPGEGPDGSLESASGTDIFVVELGMRND